MPSRNAGTRASDAGKRGACCRGTQGARGDACWGTRDACCRSLGPCCKRGKGQALPHPHRRPRTRGLRSAQGKPVMADAGRGRACRRDARDACCGGGTRARAHAEKRACQRHKKVFLPGSPRRLPHAPVREPGGLSDPNHPNHLDVFILQVVAMFWAKSSYNHPNRLQGPSY